MEKRYLFYVGKNYLLEVFTTDIQDALNYASTYYGITISEYLVKSNKRITFKGTVHTDRIREFTYKIKEAKSNK